MRRKLITALAAALLLTTPIQTKADLASDPELIKAHATAYCQTGVTASGEYTHDGICAMKSCYIGKTVIVYQRLPGDKVGDVIGTFEVKDTGGTKGLKNGSVVDIWKPNLTECQEFMDLVYADGCKGRVYIQILEAEG